MNPNFGTTNFINNNNDDSLEFFITNGFINRLLVSTSYEPLIRTDLGLQYCGKCFGKY